MDIQMEEAPEPGAGVKDKQLQLYNLLSLSHLCAACSIASFFCPFFGRAHSGNLFSILWHLTTFNEQRAQLHSICNKHCPV